MSSGTVQPQENCWMWPRMLASGREGSRHVFRTHVTSLRAEGYFDFKQLDFCAHVDICHSSI